MPHTGAFDTIYTSNIPVKIYHISNSNFSTDVLVDFSLFSLFYIWFYMTVSKDLLVKLTGDSKLVLGADGWLYNLKLSTLQTS